MSGLQQSAGAFAAGRRVEGLETLLAAWRETRSTKGGLHLSVENAA